MCGIVGYSGKNKLEVSDLKSLLIMAQARGRDSTGVATPNFTFKKAKKAIDFIKLETIPTDNLVIGHTRAKTVGAISDRNAHPFQYGDLKGVHNGGVSNFYTLKRQEGTDDMEVDSEIIWHLINKYGIKEALPKMSGGLALAWIDADRNLNLYRHTNPIYIGYRGDSLFFGSAGKYLDALSCDRVTPLDEHYRYIIKDGEIIEREDLTDCKPKRYSYSKGGSYNSGYNYGYGYGSSSYNKGGSSKKKKDVRKQYKPTHAPESASYKDVQDGPVLYYWFSTDRDILFVEPVYPGLKYDWKERFQLNKAEHIDHLFKVFPALKDVQTIKTAIEKNKD